MNGGWEVTGEEGATDSEVNGGGLLGEGGGEDEVDLRLGGEGGVELLGEGGFQAGFGGEMLGGGAGELVVAAEAERAAAACELVEAVLAEGEEGAVCC